MRISLLQQREPFGRIIERTLGTFWTERYGEAYQVRWVEKRPAFHKGADDAQKWNCNCYINSIFTSDLEPRAFQPIRQEFARSLVPWRRPLQRAYVSLAANPHTAPWLSQATMEVFPAVGESQHQLIIPGNSKLRVLDHRSGRAWSVLKSGFRPQFMRRELESRTLAIKLGLPVPAIRETDPNGAWFSEDYISGTPTNRLVGDVEAKVIEKKALGYVSKLSLATAKDLLLSDYLFECTSEIGLLLQRNHLLSGTERERWALLVARLAGAIEQPRDFSQRRVTTGLAHGDFQPGNILVDRGAFWLIDWEYSGLRQIGYDFLVLGLRSRAPKGLAERLAEFVVNGLAHDLFCDMPNQCFQEKDSRFICANLFLLEEVLLYLEENDNPQFFRLGTGLLCLMEEAQQWCIRLEV